MARYGKIENSFWHSPKIRGLSQEARYLMLYLLSCPHGNAIGCFVLHDGYIAADLGWTLDSVKNSFQELVERGLVERDQGTSLVRMLGWWGHNSIENANVAKHVAKEVAALPPCEVKERLIDAIVALSNLHPSVVQILSERLGKRFGNGSEQVSEPFTEPFRNQEPNLTKPTTAGSAALAVASTPTRNAEKSNRRGTRIATDWRPNGSDRQFACTLGFTNGDIDRIYPSFVDYWSAKAGPNGAKVDWSATWRVWMRKEAERTGRKPGLAMHAAHGQVDWDTAVADYKASSGSRWAHRQYGPAPGYGGCRAPCDVLAKYGYAQPEHPSGVSATRDNQA